MMTIRIKRQSTTAKITAALRDLIGDMLDEGYGVIVRYRGVEYGAVGIDATHVDTYEGVRLPLSLLTVRKGLCWEGMEVDTMLRLYIANNVA